MRVLRPGDKCPCCGQPIQTSERLALLTLSLMAEEMPDEVRHGRWMAHHFDSAYKNDHDVPYDDSDLMQFGCFCSECGLDSLLNGNEKDAPSKYCPHCGAKMDGGEDDA